jgi:hypothetical protein
MGDTTTCGFTWAGPTVGWLTDAGNQCPNGQSCAEPSYSGTYIGEPATTACTETLKKKARGK